jgi:UDP-N-acetyl-D-mannosaminuronate dehydrogenase
MSKICVLGQGYIGLPTALLFANNGHEVVGIDVNKRFIEISSFSEISSSFEYRHRRREGKRTVP